MSSAKSRYYANQAKKGNITKTQASNAISGKGLGSTSSGKSNTPVVSSDFIGPLAPNQTRSATPAVVADDFIGPLAPGQSRASSKSSKSSGGSSGGSNSYVPSNPYSNQNNYSAPTPTTTNRETASKVFNKAFGINTASASGFDMAPNPYQRSSISGLQSSMNNITPAATYMGERPTYTGGSNGMGGDMPQQRAPQTQQGGVVAQQYAQGSQESLLQGKMKGFGAQEKAQKKALEELIKSITKQYSGQLDNLNSNYSGQVNNLNSQYDLQNSQLNSQYDTSTKQGTSALEQAKQQDLLKLSGLFNFGANQDPNSEQRIQYEGRANNDYAGQLKDLLAKLTTGRTTDLQNLMSTKDTNLLNLIQGQNTNLLNLNQAQNKEISGAKQNYQQELASIGNQRNATQMEIAKMQQSMKGKSSGGKATSGSGKISHNDIFDYVNNSLANGASWAEIAQGAKDQKVDTSTGSYIDQLLMQANKQGKWA